ncbi:MAG: heme o synthase [Rickettsiales bacterium]|nr:heme o synthase [Rickettsiales bacterium]
MLEQSTTTNIVYTELKESSIKDFITLLKPRVISLVIFTGIIGMLLAPGTIHPIIAIIAIISISLGSGAAGALNMWYDKDIDAIMTRTKTRPIPSGKISADEALHLGIVLSILSVFIMAVFVNYLSAFLLAFSIFFYVVIYTIYLKRRTAQNIVIGGAAGAFPPIIGWTAVTSSMSVEPLFLFLIIFMWTPPHFWSLALYSAEDYKKANIPMMPVIKGIKSTKNQIVIYFLFLCVSTLLPYSLQMLGMLYLIAAFILNITFALYITLLTRDEQKYSMPCFKYSIIYLFLLFSSMILDKFYG